ncbi:putative AraC transcriptional regulatory protein [Pedobacter sp. BAL39]|uniref:AraC family transcriptional regulator n=1 Tax=Pedobacter sp. BAL39 TaxID=391596 RepID=UPI00015599E7|nr:AraC family transcriptional regulator [Pedobacter sp. BAL39]EDM37624.1 putative AraC transcriptional regulatory protein [Pedobacter sp. BAL39]
MNTETHKRRDGFEGQKLISLPNSFYRVQLNDPMTSQCFITQIGYFPKASYHYRERVLGCIDNILIYCVSGRGWYIIEQKKYEVGPGQFIHIPANDLHIIYGADIEEPWTIYWVHFSGGNMKKYNNSIGITAYDGPKPVAFNEKIIKTWTEIYQSLEMGYSLNNLRNANLCLYYFQALFYYPENHLENDVERMQDVVTETIVFMRSKFSEKLTVEVLAQRYQLSTSHFSSIFKKSTGMSPIDYFIQLKVQKACQLLYNPVVKIKDVAKAVGYEDAFYFSRIFKKLMDISPEQYRAQWQRDGNG